MLRYFLPLLILALNTGIAAAQMPPLTVPKGHWRADITGSFFTADQRFRVGSKENLAADFERSTLGSNFFPALEPADSILRKIAGFSDATINLGSSAASWAVTTGTMGLGVAYGIFSKLTVSVHIPIVRQKVRSTFGLDPELANSGFNPADLTFGDAAGQAQTNQFFQQFNAAMTQLATRLNGGEYDSDPAQKALAQETLASGTILRDDLFSLILGNGTASPFLPIATSVVGATIRGKVTSIQGALTALGVTSFATNVALPAEALTDEEFNDFVSNEAGPVAGTFSTPSLSSLGDIEIAAAYAIIDQLSTLGVKRGFRLAAQGLFRLRTSQLDNPGRFFDVGTGERQPDLEGTLVGDGLFGSFGARGLAGYTLQLAGDANKRISPPDQPIAYANTLADVNRTPGNVMTLGIAPFFRLAETYAVTGGVTWRKKGSDQVTLFGDQAEIPGAPPTLLELDTEGTWTTASLGLTYSAPLTTKDGKTKSPMDAGILWEGVIGSSGALRVPATAGVRFWFRLYGKL
jgi:hypothetical protein